MLAQTHSPPEAYECAIQREKGIEHSRTMKTNPFGGQTSITKQEPVHYVNTHGRQNQQNNQSNQRGRGGFRGRPYPRESQNTRGQQQQRNSISRQFNKCGSQYGPNHLQSCPAKDKICSKCPKRGHFAKFCRSTNVD